MKIKSLLFVTCLCVLTAPCFALLSPMHQRLKEFNTLLSSPEIANNLSQTDEIQTIQREGNTFILYTQEKKMVVEVVYTPQQRPGPKPFTLVFHPQPH